MSSLKALSYINGEWMDTDRVKTDIINPYSGERIGTSYLASSQDIEQALSIAQHAKKQIAGISAIERSKLLTKAATLLEEQKDHFAKLISLELGKPLKNTRDEVSRSIETLAQSAEEANRLVGETIPGNVSSRGQGAMAMTFKIPVGVVLAITPFNAPLNLICHKVGPAFAGGNVIILKPAPQTSAVATAFVKLLLEAGFPEASLQLVIGGVEAGKQLVTDERTNLISFTGGAAGGEHITTSAGLKKVLLELGGNGATIVHHDADIEQAASLCAKTGFSNSGQSCISVQRIYVHQEIMPSFTEVLKQKVEQLVVGDPLSSESDIGCMVDAQAAQRVETWIQEAESMGAQLLCGGKRNGASITPAILLNPPKQAKVVCEEVFGPVVSILPYAELEKAIKEANDSRYGLQAGIFTNQLDVALHAAKELETGGVVINGTSNFRLDHWPYGGIKRSGLGREGPRFAIEEMTETKMIVLPQGL
ncbi:aldehyde dehydrogenase family protein [Bacillus pumilus]|uniref:aldehyde dehydrogenase family protein n=1 Tax=Bacillus pumilus TaxID=1408 RepID=UPI00017A6A8C|nr:aldehyde dehydrogenase family protein [Bacillus pumilus]EDW20407.1 succinate-semialdehyde dehydrogenase [NADP+] (ssdh) [Bacillus pumilus ATCC 7061]MCR4354963.1 aldehyde dehydrogenase family protein [Bacillus pumilus]MCY7503892.1 aldehyde dehydrogenase family protein [Bacillus pumilus]MDR4270914.1 aldehyde dehydrogenase family protein [Bacillus pumilus]MED4628599.1 aldehyde dehydrogenase family protein [Bacillus pumilus]